MDQELSFIKIKINMQECSKKGNRRGKEKYFMKMAVYLKANFKKVLKMVKEYGQILKDNKQEVIG